MNMKKIDTFFLYLHIGTQSSTIEFNLYSYRIILYAFKLIDQYFLRSYTLISFHPFYIEVHNHH